MKSDANDVEQVSEEFSSYNVAVLSGVKLLLSSPALLDFLIRFLSLIGDCKMVFLCILIASLTVFFTPIDLR